MTENDILKIIKNDDSMMNVLNTARDLNLPQWMIGAGFIRNKIWNHLYGFNDILDTRDIDLVYYDPNGNDEIADESLSKNMREKTGKEWEIVNQYYSHKYNDVLPYVSTEDAIAQWPETVTAIGVTLDKKVYTTKNVA